jgi:general secretion pathway protein B
MSYILDALRKSDQQRQRGAVPMTLTPAATLVAAKPPTISLNVLLAAILVAAGIVIGWLRPWQPAVPAREAVTSLAASPRPALPEPLATVPETAAKPEPTLPASTATGQAGYPSAGAAMNQDAPALARTETAPPPPQAVAGDAKPATTPMPDKGGAAEPAAGAPAQGVTPQSELPAAMQQEIPRLSISLHAYASDPKDCLVMINDKLLRPGEFLSPGLRLEQVTPDGVIMSYKGYRFRRAVR